jgi:hypothetical protein
MRRNGLLLVLLAVLLSTVNGFAAAAHAASSELRVAMAEKNVAAFEGIFENELLTGCEAAAQQQNEPNPTFPVRRNVSPAVVLAQTAPAPVVKISPRLRQEQRFRPHIISPFAIHQVAVLFPERAGPGMA